MCAYMCMYVRMCICVHVCMCACVYDHIHIPSRIQQSDWHGEFDRGMHEAPAQTAEEKSRHRYKCDFENEEHLQCRPRGAALGEREGEGMRGNEREGRRERARARVIDMRCGLAQLGITGNTT